MNGSSAEYEMQKELVTKERLLWTGVPQQGFVSRPADAFLIPFSILWCGCAIFWEFAVLIYGFPLFLLLFGVPFVITGLYLVFGRFFYDMNLRQNTYYGVTSKRIVIITNFPNRKVNTINMATLGEISISNDRNDVGTITFSESNLRSWFSSGSGWPVGGKRTPSFVLIPSAKQVHDLIIETQSKIQ